MIAVIDYGVGNLFSLCRSLEAIGQQPVVTGDPAAAADYIAARLTGRTGVICFAEYAGRFSGCQTRVVGPADDPEEQARHVFDALRSFDDTDVTEIYAQCPGERGLGLAVANRLKKAAGFHVVEAAP